MLRNFLVLVFLCAIENEGFEEKSSFTENLVSFISLIAILSRNRHLQSNKKKYVEKIELTYFFSFDNKISLLSSNEQRKIFIFSLSFACVLSSFFFHPSTCALGMSRIILEFVYHRTCPLYSSFKDIRLTVS